MRNIFRFVVRIVPPIAYAAMAVHHWPHDTLTAGA